MLKIARFHKDFHAISQPVALAINRNDVVGAIDAARRAAVPADHLYQRTAAASGQVFIQANGAVFQQMAQAAQLLAIGCYTIAQSDHGDGTYDPQVYADGVMSVAASLESL